MGERIIEADPGTLKEVARLLEGTYEYVIDRTNDIAKDWLALSGEFRDTDAAHMGSSFQVILKELKGSLPLGVEAANLLRNYADWLETK
ncbi:hypothetical protein [Arabiibacter massiliensis]|uniref:hypothetical protein n=1 Tax=Arabiibacter massiliensis TaxID=1870985 RepID=UPI0009BAF588|nr:hypothetical protein [Arabiibacter massiliensis]